MLEIFQFEVVPYAHSATYGGQYSSLLEESSHTFTVLISQNELKFLVLILWEQMELYPILWGPISIHWDLYRLDCCAGRNVLSKLNFLDITGKNSNFERLCRLIHTLYVQWRSATQQSNHVSISRSTPYFPLDIRVMVSARQRCILCPRKDPELPNKPFRTIRPPFVLGIQDKLWICNVVLLPELTWDFGSLELSSDSYWH